MGFFMIERHFLSLTRLKKLLRFKNVFNKPAQSKINKTVGMT